MMDRETLRLVIIGIVSESHGADLSKPFDMNLIKKSHSTAELIMKKVDEYVRLRIEATILEYKNR